MPAKFETKIQKARFVYSPYTPQQMIAFGQSVIDANFARWDRGIDAMDRLAPPLKRSFRNPSVAHGTQLVKRISRSAADLEKRTYPYQKQRLTGRSPIRDLNLTGLLRRAIQVLVASRNRAVMGPIEGTHTGVSSDIRTRRVKNPMTYAAILAINNSRWRMWGLSPGDKRGVLRQIANEPVIKAKQVA